MSHYVHAVVVLYTDACCLHCLEDKKQVRLVSLPALSHLQLCLHGRVTLSYHHAAHGTLVGIVVFDLLLPVPHIVLVVRDVEGRLCAQHFALVWHVWSIHRDLDHVADEGLYILTVVFAEVDHCVG